MQVQGRRVELGIKVGELSITQDMIWLGAHVSVDVTPASSSGPAKPGPSAPIRVWN